MSMMGETVKTEPKFPLLLRQGMRLRRSGDSTPPARSERMQHWQHRLERLFARQEY
jgi:hypothetical protein